jgi:exodeoxyribonuclease-1
VTRFGLYRNFYDPYEREYANGNSRWDLIDVVRLTRALRPEGINWPTKDDGSNSFRLEDLTAANEIEHAGAHDALVDVKATIALAKLLKQAQPKLFDYVFTHRDKHSINTLLDVVNPKPVVHSSMRFPARLGCIASVLPLIRHPKNPNQVITYDLRVDPTPLLECDVDELKARLYTRTEDLPEGVERIALKGIRVNQAPVVVPINTLTDEAREQWDLDLGREQKHIELLLNNKAIWQKKLEALYASDDFAGDTILTSIYTVALLVQATNG